MKRMKKLCALALSAVLLAQAGTTMAFAMSNTANQENCFASLVEAAAKTPAVTVTSTILGMADTGNKTSLKKPCRRPPVRVTSTFIIITMRANACPMNRVRL